MQNGKISIGITRNTADQISLCVRDETSGIPLVQAYIDPADMMRALTGLLLDGIPAQFGDLSLVGRKQVTAEVLADMTNVDLLPNGEQEAARMRIIDNVVSELEATRPGYGWRPRYSDGRNGHRRHPNARNTYTITVFGHEPLVANDTGDER